MLRNDTRAWYLLPLAALLLSYRPACAQQERVGIGLTAPTQALDVKGNLRLRSLRPPGANQLLVAQPDGTLGLSKPLAATAGLGLYAQVAGTTPVTVGPVGGTAYAQAAASGRYVFVAGGNQLLAYDAQAVPTIPAPAGAAVSLNGTVGALAASASALYAATSAGLEVYSIGSNPALPLTAQPSVALAPTGTTSTVIYDAALAGRYLYVVARFSGSSYGPATVVRVFDLSTAQPTAVATLPLGLTGRVQLATDEGRGNLLVAPDAGSYQVYALATPTVPTPALLATAPTATIPSFGGGLAVVGGILYGADNTSTPPSLAVYDEGSPADPSQPEMLGAVPLPKTVQDLAVAGSYAYLLTADASSYQLVAVRVAVPALVGLDAAGNLASVAPVLPPSDNLGNHRATRNLDLANSQLTGNGGSQGLRIDASGRVGVRKVPANSYRLDMGGPLRANSVTVAGTLGATSFVADVSLDTPGIETPAIGAHSPLAAATGQVTGTGTNPVGSGNYTVTRIGAGNYRLTFRAGPLATGDLQQAAFVGALAGTAGFVTFTASSTTHYIDVYTRAPDGTLTDRDFTFSVFLP
jgi:hypothetical protein